MVELLKEYLTDWHTMKEIMEHFGFKDNRAIRLAIADYNNTKEVEMPYLAHSHLGYKFTTDKNDILNSCNDDIKRIRTLAKKVKKALYQVHTSDNFNIYDYLDI
jgi:hypothetical protein